MSGRKKVGAIQMQRLALEMAVKRHREQQEVEEDAPASIELTAHAEPPTLLALVKTHFDTLVQSAVFFSFIRLPPHLPRGDGVAQDKAEAVWFYCLAAAQGHVTSSDSAIFSALVTAWRRTKLKPSDGTVYLLPLKNTQMPFQHCGSCFKKVRNDIAAAAPPVCVLVACRLLLINQCSESLAGAVTHSFHSVLSIEHTPS